MVFKILPDNTDDHEKNHVALLDDRNCYVLAPAFDVRPSVAGWRDHFLALGVPAHEIARLADSIDRPFLLDQRISL